MTKTITASGKTLIAAAVLGLGLGAPVLAQTAGSTSAGVQTPASGGNEVSPRPGPLPGKSTTSKQPTSVPKSVSEAGEARPDQRTIRSTPPAGSASMENPKTPLSVKEAGDPRPLQRREGATTGETGKGSRSDKDTTKRY